jgi:hypothetical protein
MNRLFTLGGMVASVVLIAFGIGSIVIGATGRSEVSDKLRLENITGSEDMTPNAIAAASREAGVTGVALPTCSVARETVDTGAEAKCFAEYIRIHAGGDGRQDLRGDAALRDRGRPGHQRRPGRAEAPGRLPDGQPRPQRLGDRPRSARP